MDDGTGDPGDTLENGWGEVGAQNGTLIMNASLFLIAVPEPGGWGPVMGAGLLGLALLRRRKSATE